MASFSENLKQLPKVDDVERIELVDVQGMPAGVIENKPGQSGSLKARPDGTVLDGHHRLKILRERGIDIDALPREIIGRDSSAT